MRLMKSKLLKIIEAWVDIKFFSIIAITAIIVSLWITGMRVVNLNLDSENSYNANINFPWSDVGTQPWNPDWLIDLTCWIV